VPLCSVRAHTKYSELFSLGIACPFSAHNMEIFNNSASNLVLRLPKTRILRLIVHQGAELILLARALFCSSQLGRFYLQKVKFIIIYLRPKYMASAFRQGVCVCVAVERNEIPAVRQIIAAVRALFPQRRSIAACPLSVFFSILHDPRAEWTLAPQQFLIHGSTQNSWKRENVCLEGALKREYTHIFLCPIKFSYGHCRMFLLCSGYSAIYCPMISEQIYII
jgi:hypothetical protein